MSPVEDLVGRADEALWRIFDESDEARLLISSQRRIVLANRACERMFGRGRAELEGSMARLLTPPRLSSEYDRVYDALMASTDPGAVTVNLWGLRENGREFPARISCRRHDLSDGRPVLSVVVTDRSDDARGGRLREFLEAVHSANLIVDATGRIVMTNARAEEMFGYAAHELMGQSIEMVVPGDRRAAHLAHRGHFTGTARQHAMNQDNRVDALRRDGSVFPVRVMLSSIGQDEEVLIAASVIDLTEIEDLRGESDRLKDQFLATVSHELRTPLTSIMGGVEMLADEVEKIDDAALRARLERFTRAITRGARRQLALVEDLLTITAIDRGAVRSDATLSDLMVVVENVVDDCGPRAEAAGVTIVADTTGPPVLVRGDERWLERAVSCLVSNAIKFSPRGGSVVIAVGEERDRVWLEVCDAGPGIPAEEAERVFHRLYRGAGAVADEVPGAGLGLSIARSVVESVDGTLEVVPQPVGARLRMTLEAGASRSSR